MSVSIVISITYITRRRETMEAHGIYMEKRPLRDLERYKIKMNLRELRCEDGRWMKLNMDSAKDGELRYYQHWIVIKEGY
jgi:hypothetical protein